MFNEDTDEPERAMTLLVSSMSARGRALSVGRHVVDLLRRGGWTVDVRVTTSEHDVEVESAASLAPFVGALGGDGYLTCAARGRIGASSPLVPMPGGRGNDLCRSLGIGADPMDWAHKLAGATTDEVLDWVRPLDAMKVTDAEHSEMVLGLISLGIDATANRVANRSWFRSGPLAYAWGAAVAALGKYSPLPIKGSINGKPADLSGWLSSVSNTGWLGGGINLLPQSKSDDGELEVITVEGIARLRVLPKLVRVLTRRELEDPVVHLYSARTVTFEEPLGLPVMADGDIVAHLPVEVTVVPSALMVVAASPDETSEEHS